MSIPFHSKLFDFSALAIFVYELFITNCVTPWSRVLLEKLTVAQLTTFMELEVLFPCSEELVTGLYPEPDASSPHLPTLLP